jgi:ferrochelatase
MKTPTGLLLVNLGTPDAPDTPSVRRYLRQFLSDPRVLDINPVGRAALLNLVILPFRPARSAEAYRKIWGADGSPLLSHSRALTAAVATRLGERWRVELGMRYGNPSIEAALGALRRAGCDRVVVLPLYPQYSAASTGSTVEEVCRVAARLWVTPMLTFVGAFYDDPRFIEAFVAVGRPILDAGWDHVLFSYHGLPERQTQRTDETGAHCLRRHDCCDAIVAANRNCYRAQCFATTRALVAALGLREGSYSTAFQSRLGRTPWIRPFTDEVVRELAGRGVKRLAIYEPSFVADCLETLEEIGIRARDDFRAHGGEELALIPSLNATAPWVEAVAHLATTHVPLDT